MGAKEVVNYIKEYKLSERRGHRKENICFDIIVAFENGDIKAESPSDYDEFVNAGNETNTTWEALDLIKHLLKLDYVRMIILRRRDSLLSRHWSIPFLIVPENSCCIYSVTFLALCLNIALGLIFFPYKPAAES